jgi:hypothetical protein
MIFNIAINIFYLTENRITEINNVPTLKSKTESMQRGTYCKKLRDKSQVS